MLQLNVSNHHSSTYEVESNLCIKTFNRAILIQNFNANICIISYCIVKKQKGYITSQVNSVVLQNTYLFKRNIKIRGKTEALESCSAKYKCPVTVKGVLNCINEVNYVSHQTNCQRPFFPVRTRLQTVSILWIWPSVTNISAYNNFWRGLFALLIMCTLSWNVGPC